VQSTEDTGPDPRQLELEVVSYAGKVTGFNVLTGVVLAIIGTMGALWLANYFVPALLVGVPVLVSFCAAMNWLFPLSCAIFFLSAALSRIFKICLEKKREEAAALKNLSE
jgi:hypothetical protein